MFCLRCGTEIKEEDSNVYCSACLAHMEQDPVPPGIAIQLPMRTAPTTPKRTARKKEKAPEQQLARLRSANRWLIFSLVVTVAAFALAAFLLIRILYTPQAI